MGAFPYLKEIKDFDFQPSINKQQTLDYTTYSGSYRQWPKDEIINIDMFP